MGKGKNQKAAEASSLDTQKETAKWMKQAFGIQLESFEKIKPFAQMLISAGIDPIKFLQTPQGSALLAPIREAIGNEFDQSRMNAYDFFSGSGIDPRNSGLAMGPLANMFSAEASAQGNALQDFFANSLNMGMQGGNILQGQQATFNPGITGGLSLQAGNQVINAPRGPGWGLAQGLIGAGGTALGGYLARPTPTLARPTPTPLQRP